MRGFFLFSRFDPGRGSVAPWRTAPRRAMPNRDKPLCQCRKMATSENRFPRTDLPGLHNVA